MLIPISSLQYVVSAKNVTILSLNFKIYIYLDTCVMKYSVLQNKLYDTWFYIYNCILKSIFSWIKESCSLIIHVHVQYM